jgi:DNA polymerase-3 subunit beta
MRIGKETINGALSLAKGVMPSKASNPLLTYLWLEGREGDLVLRTSSGETDLEVRLPVDDGVGFAPILVPGLPFTLTVGNAPGGTVEFTLESGTVTVAARKWRASLATASPEGFPEWPSVEADVGVKLEAQALSKALSQVRYAVGKEDYRAIFRGVQLELYTEGFRTVASDGYRIAIQDVGRTEGQPVRKAVLPSWVVDDLILFLREAEEGGEVSVALAKGLMEVAFVTPWGEVRACLRLMEGEFPDYWRVIPNEFPLKAVLDAEPFREALKRVSVLADKQNHRVDLLLEEERAVLSAQGDYGRGQEEVPATLEGPSMSLAYSARFLLEALQRVSGKVALHISGQQTPTLIEPAEGGYRAVVVPLRV